MPVTAGKAGVHLVKEWIVFALCFGAGGHMALALLLHTPERWPAETLWIAGLLLALAVYGGVQLIRLLRWLRRRP